MTIQDIIDRLSVVKNKQAEAHLVYGLPSGNVHNMLNVAVWDNGDNVMLDIEIDSPDTSLLFSKQIVLRYYKSNYTKSLFGRPVVCKDSRSFCFVTKSKKFREDKYGK